MAKIRLYRFIAGWLIVCLPMLLASQTVNLVINCTDNHSINIESIASKKSFPNKALCKQYIERLPNLFQAKGFIGASVDSIKEDSTHINCSLFLGNQYSWKKIWYDSAVINILPAIGMSNSFKEGDVYNRTTAELIQSKLLEFYCNNGYPFAKISWDSITIDANTISAKLKVNSGNIYLMDSVRIIGSAKINQDYLYHLLNMPEGSVFSLEKLEVLDAKLRTISFLKQTQTWSLEMLGNSFLINLYLEPKKNNQVDAIMGFAPSNVQTGGGLLFTIDAKLKLENPLGSGETFGLNWQQIQPQSPKLNLQVVRPYIFNSAFALDFNFDLYKRDSSYLNIAADLGLRYALSTYQTAKLLFHTFRTNVLSVDTLTILATKQLPPIMDLSINQLVAGYSYFKTNYQNNPTSGNEIIIEVAGGTKQIRKNGSITQLKSGGFDYSTLYDSVKLNSYSIKATLALAHYFPIQKHATIKTALQTGMYNSPQYFNNELFLIGGTRNFRGFDEETIYCNNYLVATAEYRYLIDMNSYFSVFSDGGFTSNNITNNTYHYIGAGFGLSFQTKQGLFNISIANGKRDDLPFNFSQSKIHFGFVSIF